MRGLRSDDRRRLCDRGTSRRPFKGYYRARWAICGLHRPSSSSTAKATPRTPESARSAAIPRSCSGSVSSKGPAKPARRRGWLRSVRKAGELRRRAQRRLHLLVARRTPRASWRWCRTIRPRSTSIRSRRDIDAVARAVQGGQIAVTRRALLERRVPQRHRRAEVLAEGNARADHCAMARGASRSAARAAAHLQGVSASRERSPSWPLPDCDPGVSGHPRRCRVRRCAAVGFTS